MHIFSIKYYINSLLLGVGLAMDAFSVSIANGLSEGKMRNLRRAQVAGCFGFFQFLMPVIGWILVKVLVKVFKAVEPYIPVIAFLLLLFLGGKMILEELFSKTEEDIEADSNGTKVTDRMLFLQGIATSIDALSVGFTIESYSFFEAFLASVIIGAVTFVICMVGLRIGIKFGNIVKKATIFGGLILIFIGIEILLT